MNHEVGSAKPIGRQGIQIHFERQANRKRGGLKVSDDPQSAHDIPHALRRKAVVLP
jgi:hypothetical protein